MNHYWHVFAELVRTPFLHLEMIWGIVPLYFGLLLNELTSAKASYRTAIQTGFSFLWAGAQWLYPYLRLHRSGNVPVDLRGIAPINLAVTVLVLGFGLVALLSGIGKHFPKYGRFLGYTRFANYFMIAIFPIQARALGWTWDRLIAIALFAVPIWLVLQFGLQPLRNER